MKTQSSVAVVTGACGGMGRACARQLGRRHRLALTDISRDRVDAFAAQLKSEGHDVAVSHAGDLADDGVASAFIAAASSAGPLAAVAHTAGVSPALGPWDMILRANLVGAERLMLALEAVRDDAFDTVAIASMAGHMAQWNPHPVDDLFDTPLAPDLLQRAKPMLDELTAPGDPFGAASPAYNYSKSALIRSCRARALDWAKAGRRLNTISPGLVATPMGDREMETNEGARAVGESAPLGRLGTPIDIANLVEFLTSPLASFITAADIVIDGGVTPFLMKQTAAQQQ